MTKEKEIYDKVVCILHSRLDDFDAIPTSEIGEIVDIIKDLAQTMYYHTTIQAMEDSPTKTTVQSILRDMDVRG